MIPDENALVTALQVAAIHNGRLYTVFPNNGPLMQNVHIPGYVLKEAPTSEDVVKYFEGMVSDMGYPAPPSFSIDDIFGDNPSGTKIRAQNKTIGTLLGTEVFSPQFLYNEDPELVRETVESFYHVLEISDPALQNTGIQIIRLDVKMDVEPAFEDSSSMYHRPEYRTPIELKKLNMSPAVEYLVTKKKVLFE